MTLCGGSLIPPDVQLPDTGGSCCEGAICDGPQACTCWEPAYDLERETKLRIFDAVTPATPVEMCSDCAFRPGSPEKADDPDVVASAWELERCVTRGDPFWCHSGMPKIVGFRHPTGGYVEYVNDSAYQPRMVRSDAATVPFRADGRPALLCSGWWLQRRKHLERQPVDSPT